MTRSVRVNIGCHDITQLHTLPHHNRVRIDDLTAAVLYRFDHNGIQPSDHIFCICVQRSSKRNAAERIVLCQKYDLRIGRSFAQIFNQHLHISAIRCQSVINGRLVGFTVQRGVDLLCRLEQQRDCRLCQIC